MGYGCLISFWIKKLNLLPEGKNSVQAMHCYTFLKDKNKTFFAENFLKNGNPNILVTSLYLSPLPSVADYLNACTEGRPGKIANCSRVNKFRNGKSSCQVYFDTQAARLQCLLWFIANNIPNERILCNTLFDF